jgi:tetratricopeptide (TPR) repeat protein
MQHFSLPHSKLEIACALKFFQDAQPEDYSMSSTPDIYVPKRIEDTRANRDPVLERILEYDSYKQMRPEFKALMTQAYVDGGMAGFKKAYDSVQTAYQERGFNMETLLYKDLDLWMAENKKADEDYVEYLKFIHHELPKSIPISYDLAYWMNEQGETEEAKRLWERCLALNPEHHHAQWRLGLIALEEAWQLGN